MYAKLFVCPKCRNRLIKLPKRYTCEFCQTSYKVNQGIPLFIDKSITNPKLLNAQKGYEKIHQKPWGELTDGSYQILAGFARGNRTVDIACGDGFIEELAPLTVGVDFSLNALMKAKKRGAKHLVQAIAEALPFKDNAFDLAICNGSLEHFSDPLKAIKEMVRISRVQLLTVHRTLPLPFGDKLFELATTLFRVSHQPIEKPISEKQLKNFLKVAGTRIVFEGVWNLPVNFGRVIKWLPELRFLPSSSFLISIKKT